MIPTTYIHKLIDTESFSHYFQGIYDIKNRLKIGSETLLRSEFGDPEVIFQAAKAVNRLYELDQKSTIKALKTYTSFKDFQKKLLFINLFPSTILHPDFGDFLTLIAFQFPTMKYHLVFEILEAEMIKDFALLKERVQLIKSYGYFMGIDDVGKGFSDLGVIVEAEPHYIKLDRYFSIGLSHSHLKQEMIRSLLNYAQNSQLKVILEGIETEIDLNAAKVLGVEMCQGFLLDKPHPIFESNT